MRDVADALCYGRLQIGPPEGRSVSRVIVPGSEVRHCPEAANRFALASISRSRRAKTQISILS